MVINISSLMFNEYTDDSSVSSGALPFLAGNKTVNQRFPTGVGYSIKRGNLAASNRANSAAKVSWVASIPYLLAEGRVSAYKISQNNTLYVEIATVQNGVLACVVSKDSVRWLNIEPTSVLKAEGADFRLVPTFLWYLAYATDNETMFAVSASITDIKTMGSIKTDNAALLCDAFYYGLKSEGMLGDISSEADLSLPEINQLFRTQSPSSIKIKEAMWKSPEFVVSSVAASSTNTSNNNLEMFEDAKQGKYILPYQWSEAQKAKIIPLSFLETYIPSPKYYTLLKACRLKLNKILNGMNQGEDVIKLLRKLMYVNALCVGKPATGKTTLAQAISATFGLPYYVAPLQKDSEVDEFEGKTRTSEGGFKFYETDFLEAYTNGGVIVLEEINLANAGVTMGGIGQALVAPFVLKRDGYQTVNRHPLCVVIATMNKDTAGTNQLHSGLVSRLPLVLRLEEPTQDDIINILKTHTPDENLCKRICAVYLRIIEFLKNDTDEESLEFLNDITIRHCFEAMDLITAGEQFETAVQTTICDVIAVKNDEKADEIFSDCVQTLRI